MFVCKKQHSFNNNSLLVIGFFTAVLLGTLASTTKAQSYFLTLGRNPNPLLASRDIVAGRLGAAAPDSINLLNGKEARSSSGDDKENSTDIFNQNSHEPHPPELSQAAMDVITIVWYVATFLALAAFFLLMACSDRRCAENSINGNNTESVIAPPTPSPSYSEFAPPSYDTVMKMPKETRVPIYVIPYTKEDDANQLGNNNNYMSNNTTANSNNISGISVMPSIPIFSFYTVNEQEKPSS